MKKRHLVGLALVILIITDTVPSVRTENSPPQYYIEYEIVLTDIIGNESPNIYNLTSKDMTISLFMNDSWQAVYRVKSSYPILSETNDADGNRLALLNVTPLCIESNKRLVINATYHAYTHIKNIPQINESSSGKLKDIPTELKHSYCQPAGPWRYDQAGWKYLITIANTNLQNETNVLKILYNFVKWIGDHVTMPSKNHDRPFYPNETYTQMNFERGTLGEGDCDDQANLLVTFCRIVGIPAYLQIGCMHLPSEQHALTKTSDLAGGHLTIEERHIGFHGWTMVYVPPWGWIPVDMTMGYSKSDGPSSAILNSAILTVSTFAMTNVVKTDYVLQDIEQANRLVKFDLYVNEVYSMRVLQIKQEYGALPSTSLLLTITALVLLIPIIVGLYLIARRRRS